MGDSLALNGRVAASHFCYLLSDCQFGNYKKKSSKIVLIGSSHNQEFNKFCQISAIQATEILEFARSLSPLSRTVSDSSNTYLDHFVKYKLIYAMRLLEFGLVSEACKYMEVLAKSVNMNAKLHASMIPTIYQLANRLKVFDPDFSTDESGSEPPWLLELASNYKRIHLSRHRHLLPLEAPLQQQQQQQPVQQQSIESNSNKHLLDVVQTKEEPRSRELSPSSNQATFNANQAADPLLYNQQPPFQQQYNSFEYQQQQQQQQQQQNQLVNQMDQLALNSTADIYQQQQQQQQPANNQYQNQLSFIPVVDNFSDQQQQQQEPAAAEQPPPPPMFFNPSNFQQQQQFVNQHLIDPQSSRKSSVSSNLPSSAASFGGAKRQQMFNYPQPTDGAFQNNPPRSRLS